MMEIAIRWMVGEELQKLIQIDRSEIIRVGYWAQKDKLVHGPVNWDVPPFSSEGLGEHSLAAQIAFCRRHLDNGARMVGAFDSERLVGVGVLTPEVRPGVAQLAYLQVSSGYRRMGIATGIVSMLTEWAAEEGARQIYVSATPSDSAVGFYLKEGYVPVDEPLPELFELEPEDIHMAKTL